MQPEFVTVDVMRIVMGVPWAAVMGNGLAALASFNTFHSRAVCDPDTGVI
jgi:hypothetical protein